MLLASDTRHEFAGLFSLYEWVAIVTAVVVFAVVLFAAVRYRRRPGREPSARTEANLVELVFALVLAGVIAVLVHGTFTTENRVDAIAAGVQRQVEVTAFKWGWRFTYRGTGVSVVGDNERPPTLHLPVGEPLVFVQRSRDVVHSFWVPALRFKRDVWPDATTRFELTVERPGTYDGACAEFCGLHHTDMTFKVVAESRAQFDQWLASR
jgi:cytochrome c oxidase subunit 2